MECTRLTSSASCGVRSGSRPGRRAASIDLPAPGGPIISRLWPPAAATSSARLALSWPFTSDRQGPCQGVVSAAGGSGGVSTWVPRKWFISASRSGAASTSIRPAQAASPPCAAGQIRPRSRVRGAERRRQHAGHRVDPAIQRQLAERGIAGQFLARQDIHRGQDRQRDGQVEMAAFLGDVGRRQIHQHALRRQRQAEAGQRRAHPLPAFAHRLVGQADDQEGRQAGGDLHLHLDRLGVDAGEGEAGDSGDRHGPGPWRPGHGRMQQDNAVAKRTERSNRRRLPPGAAAG